MRQRVVQAIERRGGIQRQTWTAAEFADQADRAVHMPGCLGMKADPARAGPGKGARQFIHWLHHQMHIDRRLDATLAQRLADQRADGQVRHVVVVHHVEMNHVGTGREYGLDFLAEPGEIRREDGRSDQAGG